MEPDDRYKYINKKYKGLIQVPDEGYYNKKRKDTGMKEKWKPKKSN